MHRLFFYTFVSKREGNKIGGNGGISEVNSQSKAHYFLKNIILVVK